MTLVADAYGNPLIIDGETTPPMRSAFDILGAEVDELGRMTPEALVERALVLLRREPDLATVYGRTLDEESLETAGRKLRDPKNRALSELLDHVNHRFDLSCIEELRQALAIHRRRLGRAPTVRVSDLRLLGELLHECLGEIEPPPAEPFAAPPPDLPPASEILADLV